MIQFYAPDIETNAVLPEIESGHCCRVLRKKEGDTIAVSDGKGHRYTAEITLAHPKHTALRIIDKTEVPTHWGAKFTLAVAPTKNVDRMEWLVEKATEMGVDEIVLLRCAHSERKVMKTERLEKIIVSAMNQSLKATLPKLSGPVDFRDFISSRTETQKFMGYCDPAIPRASLAKESRPASDTVILIGPEGDFSPEEVQAAIEKGFSPVTFGESRLRTETAALFALQILHTINILNSSC